MKKTGVWGEGLSTALLVLGVLGTGASALGFSTQGQPIWSLESDGTWSSSVVSLGAQGSRVLTQVDMSSGDYMVFSGQPQQPPVPIVEEGLTGLTLNVMLDSAVVGDRHVSAHQQKSEVNTSKWRTVLRGHDTGGLLWEYTFPPESQLFPGSGVAIDADGSVAVGALWDIETSRTTVVSLDALSGFIAHVHVLPIDGRLLHMALSGDGSTLVMISTMRVVILDVDSGAIRLSKTIPGQPSFGALDISADGSVVAFGTTEKVTIYREESGTYSETAVLPLPSGSAARRLAVSPDGTRMACGLWYPDHTPLVDIRAYNLDSGAMTMHFESTVPGALENTINGIDITSDGTRFAVGMYGDEQHSLPEIMVFDTNNDQPVLTIDRPGSILDLDMSGDGTKLAVTTKGEHYTQGGGLGSVDLFDITADSGPSGFSFTGEPSLGSVVRFRHDLEGAAFGRVFMATELDQNPAVYGNIGTLFLSRQELYVLPMGTINNQGQMVTPYLIPGVQEGRPLYFQGLAIGPRKLTENYIELTVLP